MGFTAGSLQKQNVFLEIDYSPRAKYRWDLHVSTLYNMNWKLDS